MAASTTAPIYPNPSHHIPRVAASTPLTAGAFTYQQLSEAIVGDFACQHQQQLTSVPTGPPPTAAGIPGRSLPAGHPPNPPPRHRHIRSQTLALPAASARSDKGGKRRQYPKATIAILEDFAVTYGRYPSSDEAKELVERAKDETGYQTTVSSIKTWFYQHRVEFDLMTLADSRIMALDFGCSTPGRVGRGVWNSNMPGPSRATAGSVPLPHPSTSTNRSHILSATLGGQRRPCTPPPTASSARALSQAQVEVLKAIQASGIDKVNDAVLSACAESWAVDRCLIEDWLRPDQSAYRPPTPTSPPALAPDFLEIPRGPIQADVSETFPEEVIFIVAPLPQFPPQPDREGDEEYENDQTYARILDQFTRGWSTEPPEKEMTDANLPAGVQLPSIREPAMDPFVGELIEALREAVDPPRSSLAKPTNAREFRVLWPIVTLTSFLHRIQVSQSLT